MAERGELDKHADWLMLQSNKDYRRVAADYLATFGTTVSHTAIMRWYKRRARKDVEIVARADAVQRVTAELLEGVWVRGMNGILAGMDRARADNDEEGERRWTALARQQVETLLKGYNAPQIVAAPVTSTGEARSGTALRDWARRVLAQSVASGDKDAPEPVHGDKGPQNEA